MNRFCRGLNLESCLFFSTEESSLVGLEDRALRFYLNIITEELGLVNLEPLSVHVSWYDTVLDSLESIPKCLVGVSLAKSSVKELRSVQFVLGRCV